MITAYPLSWPAGWKRTELFRRSSSKFKAEFTRSRDGLLREIRLMGGTQLVLSTNIPLTRDGLPYGRHAPPADPGVAVYFQWKGKAMSLACDKWRSVAENVRALELTVEAMRGIERWGSSELMERTFTGFTALPAPDGPTPLVWWQILGVERNSGVEAVKRARNDLLRKHHPDIGTEPSAEKSARVNAAFEQALGDLDGGGA